MASEEGIVDDFAKKEFIYADPQSARDALHYAINLHKEMQNKSRLWGWPEKSDLGWCYAELSMIEESEGNIEVAFSDIYRASTSSDQSADVSNRIERSLV